jgi:hypothetical protein
VILERHFVATCSVAAAWERALEYMTAEGYRLAHTDDLPRFERGSWFGSLMPFSPRGWQTAVVLRLTHVGGATDVEVNTSAKTPGRFMTGAERAFWGAEMEGLEAAMCGVELPWRHPYAMGRPATGQTTVATVLILLVTMALGMLGFLVGAWLFETLWAGITGSIIGGVAGILLGAVIAGFAVKLMYK